MPKPPARPRLPITPQILRGLKSQWLPLAADQDYVMLWAACCVGFFGFLRAGEFTLTAGQDFDPSSALTVQDVSVDYHTNPSMVRLHLKQSKTDPFRHGVDVFLGRTNMVICPVAALLAYVAVRPSMAGPLFIYKDGTPLTRERLVVAVRHALERLGHVASQYSGHSFRIGAATTAAQAGLEDSVVKMMGRWESSAYLRYICTPRDSLATISVHLARADM